MSEDDYRLSEAIIRIKNRVERMRALKDHFDSEIDSMVEQAKIDIKSLQLQLGVNRSAPKDSKRTK